MVKNFEQEQAISFFKVASNIFSFLHCSFLKVETAVCNTEIVSTQHFPKEYNLLEIKQQIQAAIGLNLPQEHQRVFPILQESSSESDDSFPYQFSFRDSFETQGLHMYDCSFLKSDKYSSSEVSLSSVPLFSSSRALFVSSDFDIFMMKLCFTKICFESLVDILVEKALSTIVFFECIDTNVQKEINNFVFK